MKKTIGVIVAVLILVAIFGWGVFRFKVGINDKSIDFNIGGTK